MAPSGRNNAGEQGARGASRATRRAERAAAAAEEQPTATDAGTDEAPEVAPEEEGELELVPVSTAVQSAIGGKQPAEDDEAGSEGTQASRSSRRRRRRSRSRARSTSTERQPAAPRARPVTTWADSGSEDTQHSDELGGPSQPRRGIPARRARRPRSWVYSSEDEAPLPTHRDVRSEALYWRLEHERRELFAGQGSLITGTPTGATRWRGGATYLRELNASVGLGERYLSDLYAIYRCIETDTLPNDHLLGRLDRFLERYSAQLDAHIQLVVEGQLRGRGYLEEDLETFGSYFYEAGYNARVALRRFQRDHRPVQAAQRRTGQPPGGSRGPPGAGDRPPRGGPSGAKPAHRQ